MEPSLQIARLGDYNFRDVLFKRYSDVPFLLETLTWDDLLPFVSNMYESVTDELLYQSWLANPLSEESFDEYKTKAYANAENASNSHMSEKEVQAQADDLETWFKERGGGDIGG